MKLRSAVVILWAMWTSAASATLPPTWERYPNLVCRLDDEVACSRENCEVKPMKGMVGLDFQRGVLTRLGGGDTEAIVGRHQMALPGSSSSFDAVLLSSSRMINFLNIEGEAEDGQLPATLVRSLGRFTRTIYMSCAVPK